MIKYLIVFLIIGTKLCVQAQQPRLNIVPLNKWNTYPLPNDSTVLSGYGDDTTAWELYSRNNTIYALNVFHPDARECIPGDSLPKNISDRIWKEDTIIAKQGKSITQVDDGYIIAINSYRTIGIFWYSKDGKIKRTISNDKVLQLIKQNNHIYGIQSIPSPDTPKGALIELEKADSKWIRKKIVSLTYEPFSVDIDNRNNFIIGTTDNIIEISKDGREQVLYDNPIWYQYDMYLYPESLITKNNIIYVGMRKGILKLNIKTRETKWLMKD
jgi:hypothetical protein